MSIESDHCKECVSGNIEVVKKLGEGSFGSVYHVMVGEKKRHLAMKQMSTNYSNIFIDCKEAIRVAHKNVIAFFWCSWMKHENGTEGHLNIFMELCMEKNLSDWIDENKTVESRNLEDMKFWIKQILSALDWFHAIGLIHRDLKPANIFFARNSVYGARGTLKIGDLGMIKIREHQESLKPDENGLYPPLYPPLEVGEHKYWYGTEEYAAPELLSTNPYNNKVDVFSLGMIAAELICPYKNEGYGYTVRKAFREEKIPKGFEGFPDEINDFLSKATKRNLKDRLFARELLEHPFLSNVPTLEQELKKNFCENNPQCLLVDEAFVRVGFAEKAFNKLKAIQISDNDEVKLVEKVVKMQMILAGSAEETVYCEKCSIENINDYLSDLIYYGERTKHMKVACFGLETTSFDAVKTSYTSAHVKLIPSFKVWLEDECREWMKSMLEENSEELVFSNGNQPLRWITREDSGSSTSQEQGQEIERLLATFERLLTTETVVNEPLTTTKFQKAENNTDEITSIKAYLRFLLGACKFITSWGKEDFDIDLLNDIDGFSGMYITNNSFVLPTFEVYRMQPIEHWESWSEIVWPAWWKEESENEADDNKTDLTAPFPWQDILNRSPRDSVTYLL
ncbi:hypothetical protein GCK72_004079 [Caenorhabditis remanei]|uniref:Protein kinase domain-containing protein n=1 Tax=Caenorhabditis remanei TaxID=31234 RepID=A0A6A5HCM4_CAERE|nr:hypothetical protein GCK72_004079 [Caenorhabditis remanei]KAF1764132.1 hypothetical protein GCK72_004079 [Caenorhabditis remanei]